MPLNILTEDSNKDQIEDINKSKLTINDTEDNMTICRSYKLNNKANNINSDCDSMDSNRNMGMRPPQG